MHVYIYSYHCSHTPFPLISSFHFRYLCPTQKQTQISVRAIKGGRVTMEDEYFVAEGGRFVAVFDGHGGGGVSQFLKRNLYQELLVQLRDKHWENSELQGNASSATRKNSRRKKEEVPSVFTSRVRPQGRLSEHGPARARQRHARLPGQHRRGRAWCTSTPSTGTARCCRPTWATAGPSCRAAVRPSH